MLQNIFRRAPSRVTVLVVLVVILIFRQSSSDLPHLEDARSLSNYLNNTIRNPPWAQISLDRPSTGADPPAEPKPCICPGCPNATAVVTKHITDPTTCPTLAIPQLPVPTMRKVPETAASIEQEIMNNMREEGILVIFKTGAQELAQLAIHLGTTLRFFDQQDILFFSDMHDFLGPFTVHDSLRNVNQTIREHHPEFEIYRKFLNYHANGRNIVDLVEGREKGNDRTGWRLDKWKFIHMIEDAFEMRPNAKWYFFIETDTYVIWPNLVAYLKRLDHTKPLYLGSGLSIGAQTFGHGGSGYVISHAAMNKLLEPSQPEDLAAAWDLRMDEHCCGDLAVAIALQEKGIPLTIAHPFFNGYKPSTFTYGPKNHWCQPAITMHHITHVDVSDYWRYERQREMIQGTKNLTLFSDLYHYFAEPHIRESRDNWDNLSHGPTYSKEIMDRIEKAEKGVNWVEEEASAAQITETREKERQLFLAKLKESEEGRRVLENLLQEEKAMDKEKGVEDEAQEEREAFLDKLKDTEEGRKVLENLMREKESAGGEQKEEKKEGEKQEDGDMERKEDDSKDAERKGESDTKQEDEQHQTESKENPTSGKEDKNKDNKADEKKPEEQDREPKDRATTRVKIGIKKTGPDQEQHDDEEKGEQHANNEADDEDSSLDNTASDLFSRKRDLESPQQPEPEPELPKAKRAAYADLAKIAYHSFEDCRNMCESVAECFQFVFYDDTCRLGYSFRLGQYVDVEREGRKIFKSGWMVDKIRRWTEENACREPRWEWY
ncbi:glycosyltransferase family 31 protein [Phlyctema vagabunda]|uniref:N-acetylgalactosaminide beta-1,3-galactosyltransferase n=1 Tax=Phlyctema vagabunda TaxID=108571 RepID=A0ABR4PQ20_9HELO